MRFGKYVIKTRTGEVKRQRYRCKSCRLTFNDLTNTPLQLTRRPHLWVRFVEMDETYFLFSEKGKKNISDRKSRKRGGKAKYRGISNDQVCVLVARDRQKMTFSGVLGRGRIRTSKLDEAGSVT